MMFDGERYGVPSGTDGRVIYFNKEIFAEAGLPEDWQPATVDEVLEAARTIKESQPDVTPIQLNAGVAMGEATTMQGMLPLLAAAGAEIYDEESSMWTGATPEMVQVLETYATVYGDEGLGDPDLQVRQDGRDRSFLEFSEGKIAMLLESDYFWRDVINPEAGVAPMENRDEVVGWASIPGYEPGGALGGNDAASMSGGGGFLVNPNSENAEMAWELLKFMNSKESVTQGAGDTPKITQREDVNAEILDVDPMLKYIAEEVLPVTHYRPGLAQYPQVSVAMQEASEAVVTGTSADDAARLPVGIGAIAGTTPSTEAERERSRPGEQRPSRTAIGAQPQEAERERSRPGDGARSQGDGCGAAQAERERSRPGERAPASRTATGCGGAAPTEERLSVSELPRRNA
ncbi:MAG: extracellular solute-binding protein [Ilumatobacteraceae bacterium]